MTLMRGICSLAMAGALGLCAVSARAGAGEQTWGDGGYSHCDESDTVDTVDTIARSNSNNKWRHCPGTLIIKKVAIGGDDDFKFTKARLRRDGSFKSSEDDDANNFTLRNGQTKLFTVRRTGTFRVEEFDLPNDWSLRSISCTSEDFNVEGNALYVHVVRGETVTCTFTNFKGHDDTTRKATELFVRRRLDNLLTNGPDRARLLRRLEPVEQLESLKDGPIKLAADEPRTADDDGAPGEIRAMRGDAPTPDQTRSGNPLFDGIAGQLVSAFGNTNDMRFSASLSDLRADAARSAARDAAKKAQSAGAGLDATRT